LVIVVALHWGQFLALFGAATEKARFDLTWKHEQLPVTYIAAVMIIIVLFEVLPYLEEFFRGLRANSGRLVPAKAKRHKAGDTAAR
ncbi:MAG: diguanylate cyclase, partial [Mesorhizobium sp.]